MALRIATFNLESLDQPEDASQPSLDARIAVLGPQLERLRADVLCLQEVNARHPAPHAPRELLALDRLLAGTRYQDYVRVASAHPGRAAPSAVHNLVVLSRHPVRSHVQHLHDRVPPPRLQWATADPPATAAEPIEWDRPILEVAIELPEGRVLHVVDVHFRAPRPVAIPGQKHAHAWRSIAGWAEGYYVAALKRAGQALETRMVVDTLLDAEPDALLAVVGDFNCDAREVGFEIVRGGADYTGNPALAGRALIALEQTVAAERRFSVRHAGRAVMLDHILTSPALAACHDHVEIHNEALEDEAVAEGAARSPVSYHAPVVADFRLG